MLSFNSAQATSGVREVLRFMIEQNMIDIAIASPKGIDADIAKAVGKFGSDSIKNVFDFALEQLRKLT